MSRNGNRKLQCRVNKVVRAQNKSIENDNLWKGRFVVRQLQANIKQYDDNSGWYGHFVMRIYDKKTGLFRDEIFDNYDFERPYGWDFFWFINNFIVDDVKVWEENPSPRDDNFAPKNGYRDVPLRAVKRVGWEKRISGK